MLDLEQIRSFYPPQFHPHTRNIVREYLQFKILAAIFSTEPGRRLVFLGGTAIHIIHGNPRFSEDLDFDNKGLDMDAFEKMASVVRAALMREGYDVELAITGRGGHCRAKLHFAGLLQRMGMTGHREEKLLIHLDAEPQDFDYTPDQVILNKFDVFCRINAVPIDILLSQKIACILQRPRPMGRDFYDAVFLWGKTGPNAAYLARKAGIRNEFELWDALELRCRNLDFEKLAKDIQPFVSHAAEAEKVKLFRAFVAARRSAQTTE